MDGDALFGETDGEVEVFDGVSEAVNKKEVGAVFIGRRHPGVVDAVELVVVQKAAHDLDSVVAHKLADEVVVVFYEHEVVVFVDARKPTTRLPLLSLPLPLLRLKADILVLEVDLAVLADEGFVTAEAPVERLSA